MQPPSLQEGIYISAMHRGCPVCAQGLYLDMMMCYVWTGNELCCDHSSISFWCRIYHGDLPYSSANFLKCCRL